MVKATADSKGDAIAEAMAEVTAEVTAEAIADHSTSISYMSLASKAQRLQIVAPMLLREPRSALPLEAPSFSNEENPNRLGHLPRFPRALIFSHFVHPLPASRLSLFDILKALSGTNFSWASSLLCSISGLASTTKALSLLMEMEG